MVLLQKLHRSDQGPLRLVCKQLRDLVNNQTCHIYTRDMMTRKRAQALSTCFPKLTSLEYMDPDTTYFLPILSRLTRLSLNSEVYTYYHDHKHLMVDLGPLQDLPQLRTLQLGCVALQRLSAAHPSALAGLKQLQTLELSDCVTRTVCGNVPKDEDDLKGQRPQNIAVLPGLTKLQVVDSLLWVQPGLKNLHRVRLLAGGTECL